MIALGALVVGLAVQAPPRAPLRAYVERRDACEHWAGEEGFDAARRRQIDQAVARLRCEALDGDRRRLRRRFTDPAARRALRPLYF